MKFFFRCVLFSLLLFQNFYFAAIFGTFNDRKILLLYTGQGPRGGTRSYKISLYSRMLNAGFNVGLFVVNNPEVCAVLDSINLPYYKCDTNKVAGTDTFWDDVYNDLKKVCSSENVGLINCNTSSEVSLARRLAKKKDLKIVLTIHIETTFANSVLDRLDGVLSVNPSVTEKIKVANKKYNLGIKKVEWIAPFFDADKFLNFNSVRSKYQFFRDEFGIDINDSPIITMVANFLDNSKFKDHPTLFKAMSELIFNREIKLNLVLAGEGPRLDDMRKLVKELKLSEYVHFLGRTELVAELFYNSSIKVLASKSEAFGIVLLEAALMRKPLIGTQGTGMETFIKQGKTGLLFKKGDAIDLADKIELLLNDSSLCKELTYNAYASVCNDFLPDIGLQKISKFYFDILNNYSEK